MSRPLGYLLTWTTYGTWLPGDRRGWVDDQQRRGNLVEKPEPLLENYAKERLREEAVTLDAGSRNAVEDSLRKTCRHNRWWLHSLAVRSNHVHVVVSAPETAPGKAMGVLKAAATRHLRRITGRNQKHWWTMRGSKRFLNSEKELEAAIQYVLGQDSSWKKRG